MYVVSDLVIILSYRHTCALPGTVEYTRDTGDKHYKYVCSKRFSQNGSLQELMTVIPTFHCVVFLPCLANVEIQDNQ